MFVARLPNLITYKKLWPCEFGAITSRFEIYRDIHFNGLYCTLTFTVQYNHYLAVNAVLNTELFNTPLIFLNL